jgi:hypothetical protein
MLKHIQAKTLRIFLAILNVILVYSKYAKSANADYINFISGYLRPRINPNRSEMIASTNRICISPLNEATKKPKNHPITRITAIRYNNPLMTGIFS